LPVLSSLVTLDTELAITSSGVVITGEVSTDTHITDTAVDTVLAVSKTSSSPIQLSSRLSGPF
jgi:6,7-dimethyl-8-ribityllumazine synthase